MSDGFESSPLKKMQPGDLLDVVQKLRIFMSQTETAGYALYASYDEIGGGIEKEAEKARHTLELATARVAGLLAVIEQHPTFVEIRQKLLDARKGKVYRDE